MGVRRICDESGFPPGRSISYARHDRCDERPPRGEGRAGRPDHTRFQADPPPRALANPGAACRLDHHDQARSSCRARGHARGERADGARGEASCPSTAPRSRGSCTSSSTPASIADRLADQLVRQPRTRARDQGDHPRSIRLPGHDLLRRPSGVPRVRADVHGVHELLRAPEGRGLRVGLQSAREEIGVDGRSEPAALGRGADDGKGEAVRNPIYGILSGPSGGVAGALHVARRAGYENILTFDMGGTSTDVALSEHGQPTIERQTAVARFPRSGAERQRPLRRCRRRLDRPCPRGDRRPAGRPPVGRRGARAGLLRPGRRAHGHRRERDRRPPAAAAPRRRDGARRRRSEERRAGDR